MLQCKVRHFRALIYYLASSHMPSAYGLPPSHSNLQSPCAASPPSTLSLLQVVSLSSNSQDTLPELNSSETKAIPRLIINLLDHLGPSPWAQVLSRLSQQG